MSARPGPKPGPAIPCNIEGCSRPAKTRTWCNTHYEYWRRTGKVGGPPKLTLWERFWPKVNADGVCWEWTAARPRVAHRASRIRMVDAVNEPTTPPPGRPGISPDLPTPAEALTIRPGQTLILRYDKLISSYEAEQVKGKLAERIPEVGVVIISGCQQMAIYDSGEACGACGGLLIPQPSDGYICDRCGLWQT